MRFTMGSRTHTRKDMVSFEIPFKLRELVANVLQRMARMGVTLTVVISEGTFKLGC